MRRSEGNHLTTENRRKPLLELPRRRTSGVFRKDKVAQRSLVAVLEEKDSVSDPYEDNQTEFGGVASVIKPQKAFETTIYQRPSSNGWNEAPRV